MWCCQVVMTTTNSIIALNLYYLIANTNKQNAPYGNVVGRGVRQTTAAYFFAAPTVKANQKSSEFPNLYSFGECNIKLSF